MSAITEMGPCVLVVEDDQIGRALGDGNFRLIAAVNYIDGVTFGLKIVA